MILKHQVMEMLLNACPSFKEPWKEYFDYSYQPGDEQLLYVDLGEFAVHLVNLYKGKSLLEFPDVFEVIERLHIEGDDFVKESATIGLLEGIQNVAGNNDLNPEGFYEYLKPESQKWWDILNDFWSGRSPSV